MNVVAVHSSFVIFKCSLYTSLSTFKVALWQSVYSGPNEVLSGYKAKPLTFRIYCTVVAVSMSNSVLNAYNWQRERERGVLIILASF